MKLTQLGLALGIGLVAHSAQAGLLIEKQKEAPVPVPIPVPVAAMATPSIPTSPVEVAAMPVENVRLSPVIVSDSPGFRGDVVMGFGRDVSVSDAILQVLPKGWELMIPPPSEALATGIKVTWRGGAPWIDVMREFMRDTGLVAQVSVLMKSVTLVPAYEVENRVKGVTFRVLREDKTLRTTFERWAREAGWEFDWTADRNISLSAYPAFTVDFKDAVTQSVDAVNADADYQIGVDFHELEGQKLLRVYRYLKEATR